MRMWIERERGSKEERGREGGREEGGREGGGREGGWEGELQQGKEKPEITAVASILY